MEATSARKFKSICVFAGTNHGRHEEFAKAALNLGKRLAERKINLVYGGGCLGLMGVVSTAAHLGGSHVLGIIPKFLTSVAGKTVGEELAVSTMYGRMSRMLDNAEAFIALPGGFGTLEEIFQIVSWAQLCIHQKPIGLLNVNGYYDSLISFLDHAMEQNFLSQSTRRILLSASTPDELIDLLQSYVPQPDPALAPPEDSKGKKRKLDLTLRL